MKGNTPFEGLAEMCNVSAEEINKSRAKAKRVRVCKHTNGTAITETYNAALKVFKTKSNVLSIARANKTTSESVVRNYCRKTLEQRDASRVTELVMNSLAN